MKKDVNCENFIITAHHQQITYKKEILNPSQLS